METNDKAIFRAIADPTRREILHILSGQIEGAPIGHLADRFTTSRQAVTKHIKILEDSGLLRLERQGRESWCHAELAHLQVVYQWVNSYRQFWASKLGALGDYLDRESTAGGTPTPP